MDSAFSPTSSDPEHLARLCARALAVRHREPGAARELAERALAAALDAKDPALECRARATLGACLSSVPAEVPRGRDLLHEVLDRCRGADDQRLRCEVMVELGSNYASTFEYEPALRHAREAVDLSRRSGHRAGEARALRLLGSVLSSTGDFVQALTTLQRALELHEALVAGRAGQMDDADRWERAKLFGRIAVVYSNLDQGERALSYYQVALETFGDRYPLSAARTLYRMGIAAESTADPARAEGFYRRCLDEYQALGNVAGSALGYLGLSRTLLLRGALDEADDAARRAVAGLAGDPVHMSYYADALWVLSDVHLRAGRHADALACLDEALPLFLKADRPAAHMAALHRRYSTVHAEMGSFGEALGHHQRFHQLTMEHVEEQAGARMARLMVEFDTERAMKDREIHRLRTVELEREIAERKEAEAALARARAELEETNRELHALAIRDALTGVFNRRYLDQRLAEAMALAARRAQPLSVMICDVDDFKRINDSFSHAVGDEVLRTVAGLLRQHVRQSDVVARFGGEEFVVLFPATTLEQASAACEKVCRVVREFPWSTLHPELSVTISAGVAAADGHPNHEKLLLDADRKLYQAKRRGKNRVVV